PARLTLKISGRPMELDYDGSIQLGRSPEAEGMISAKSPSLKALLALVGVRPAPGVALNSASLTGRLRANEAAITLTDGAVTFDQLAAKGTVTVEQRPGRPYVRGNLQIAELDLNRLAVPSAGAIGQPIVAPAAIRPASVPKAAAPQPKPAQSIEDLLRDEPPKSGARVQGYTKRHGWSDEAIDLSGLRLADADLKLDVGRLIYRDIKVGQTQIRLALKDRALTANFDDIQLYDGRGRGLLTVDGAAAVPAIGANFSLDGTSAMALLKDAADFDWIAGKAKVNIALGGMGGSERQIVASLNGRTDVQFRDGAVVGYNVQQVLSGISQGRFAGLERNPAAKTDFSEMAASFMIQNGVATNKDLRLISPTLRIVGAGTANLPERTMDYLLRPRLVAAGDSGGLEVPVKLAG
ncbi:MAG: AsmA-like C-terminal region-containing protein, partial [Hyphomicrobiaceae bacterium]